MLEEKNESLNKEESIVKSDRISQFNDTILSKNDTQFKESRYKANDVSPEEYLNSYSYVCTLCTRRYSSITGLNYHLSSFDHSNPPPNYDPHKISKRGRPRGYRPAYKYKTQKLLLSIPDMQDESYTSRSGRRVFRPGNYHSLPNNNDDSKNKLTYSESKRFVEFEHNNKLLKVELDEMLQLIHDNNTHANSINTTTFGRNGVKRKLDSLPQCVFSIIDDYYSSKEPTNNYILTSDVYFHPSYDKNDSSIVDYEMDEEDVAWINLVNENRQEDKITSQTFEFIMDRLEKESEFIGKISEGTNVQATEDVVCAVCMDGDCNNTNLIVFCDICNMPVHQDCYGLPYVPEGQWLCRRCTHAPSKELQCVLCPNKGGVFKQTTDNKWCHIICAILMPGAKFSNVVFLEPIDLSDISRSRFNVRCKICGSSNGAVIQCYQSNCCVTYHVSCAQINGWIYLEKSEVLKSTDSQSAIPQVNHRYLSFCTKHSKQNSTHGRVIMPCKMPSKVETTQTIHVPVISDEHLNQISSKLELPDSMETTMLVKRYWQIKRYMRSGVPLLRRCNYLSRNVVNNFKIDDKNIVPNSEIDKELCEKLTKLESYIKGLKILMDKLKEREILKNRKSLQKRKTYDSILNIIDFLNKLLNFIEDNLKTDKMNIKFEKDEIFKKFYSLFDVTNISTIKNFTDTLYNTFDEYLKETNKNGRDSSEFDTIISYILIFLKNPKNKKNGSLKQSCSTPTTIINSSFMDISPTSIDIKLLVNELVKDIPKSSSNDENCNMINTNVAVWAKHPKVKYFPAKVIDVVKNKKKQNSNYLVKYFTQNNDDDDDTKVVSLDHLTKCGFDTNIDKSKLLHSLTCKSYDRNMKREILNAYKEAREYIKTVMIGVGKSKRQLRKHV